jgi:hypothetical protein
MDTIKDKLTMTITDKEMNVGNVRTTVRIMIETKDREIKEKIRVLTREIEIGNIVDLNGLNMIF